MPDQVRHDERGGKEKLSGLKINFANFPDPGSHGAEFFDADLCRFFLEAELMRGGTIDQIGVFENVGGIFIHHAGFNQRLQQPHIIRPLQEIGIFMGL